MVAVDNQVISDTSGDTMNDAPPLAATLVWNIVTRGQKEKDNMEIEGPSLVTHNIDEAGSSSSSITPSYRLSVLGI